MFRAALGAGRGPKKRFDGDPCRRFDSRYCRCSVRECAGLVKEDGIEQAECLQIDSALMIAPCRATRPIAPRMASGVPSAIPHAPATITTEIVDLMLCVMK
jgi:hypothetical protein